MADIHYGMLIDTKRCIGCWSCSVACKVHNNVPNDVWWSQILTVGGDNPDTPSGKWPDVKMDYVPMACQHCENPACVEACPTGATYKTDEGIVMQDTEKCIGCRTCITACPYSGARVFLAEEPTYMVDFPVGDLSAPVHIQNTVEKCTMCASRIAEGKNPACVDGCPTRARIWGDLNDPESDISKKLAERESYQLLPEAGTNPSVYYLK